MRRFICALVVGLTFALAASLSHAAARPVNNLNEPGSLLAYPLITIINIANTGADPAVLECYMVTQGVDGTIDEKKDFVVKLTGKEKFVWMSSQPYNQRGNQIQGFAGRKGYMFCYAIDNVHDQLEIGYDFLKGDATLLNPHMGVAFNYNAIPHQTGEVLGDRILRLDGNEYTMATSQIMFEGLAEVPCCIGGILAVASPGIDFVDSMQPEFDINLFCWNEVETKFSRHVPFKDFAQYDLTRDLQLDIRSLFMLGWHCATTSTNPLWAVFHQSLGGIYGWGGNVFQEPTKAVPATIVLPPVPVAP
jgi:hypothetical protein